MPAGLGCFFFFFRGGGADADDARSRNADGGRRNDLVARGGRRGGAEGGGERERSPCRGCTRASSAAPCDREPGALRLAAVEPEDADGVMLLLVRLGAAITASPDHTTAPRRKGVWHRPAADTKRAQAPSRREVVWIAR